MARGASPASEAAIGGGQPSGSRSSARRAANKLVSGSDNERSTTRAGASFGCNCASNCRFSARSLTSRLPSKPTTSARQAAMAGQANRAGDRTEARPAAKSIASASRPSLAGRQPLNRRSNSLRLESDMAFEPLFQLGQPCLIAAMCSWQRAIQQLSNLVECQPAPEAGDDWLALVERQFAQKAGRVVGL